MSDINSWNTTDASNNASPPDGFPENMAYSAVNNAARAVMGGVKRWFADLGGSLAGGGSADAYTVTLNQGYSAYFEGMMFSMSIPADCTGGAVTLNVNSIGNQSVVDHEGNNPRAGSLQSGGIYTFIYNGTDFQVAGASPLSVLRLQTAADLTNGGADDQTSVDVTGIPSWVQRITIILVNASTVGNDVPMIQLGDSGGIETSGYTGAVGDTDGGSAHSTGFELIDATLSGATLVIGKYRLDLVDSSANQWMIDGGMSYSAGRYHGLTGLKSLSGALTQIRLTTQGGTETFDNGEMIISYE